MSIKRDILLGVLSVLASLTLSIVCKLTPQESVILFVGVLNYFYNRAINEVKN